MDRQNQAKALLPIIQALAEGKKIQYSFNGTTWLEEDMDFELSTICNDICAGSCDYRIKPEDCSTCMLKEGSCYPNTTIFDKDKRCKGYQPETVSSVEADE